MPRFCGNCGAKLEENAKVCGYCGTPVNPVEKKIAGVEYGKKKGHAKLVMVMIVLLILIVFGFNVILSYTGCKGLIRQVMKAYKEYDIDTLVEISSGMYADGMEDIAAYYFEYTVGDDLDTYEDAVGHKYKLSYEINEIYTMSERRLSELLNNISEKYPAFDVNTIQKVKVAELTVTAKEGSRSSEYALQLIMSKEEGSWKLMYIE